MSREAEEAEARVRRRIEQLNERLGRLRRGDPVTAPDVGAERINSVASAERAEIAALAAAAAWIRFADMEDRLADAIVDLHPEQAQKLRDAAEAARRHAQDDRDEADEDHWLAAERRNALPEDPMP